MNVEHFDFFSSMKFASACATIPNHNPRSQIVCSMMAGINGVSIPIMKVENAPSPQVKDEAREASPSPYMEEDDVYEDAGDLDFSHSQQQFWLSRVPKSLWELWASMPEDSEVEIGTIRIEGDSSDPKRVRTYSILFYRLFINSLCSGQPKAEPVTTFRKAAQRIQPPAIQKRDTTVKAPKECIHLLGKGYARV